MVKKENGINWTWYKSKDKKELEKHYKKKTGVEPYEGAICLTHTGEWGYRIHK